MVYRGFVRIGKLIKFGRITIHNVRKEKTMAKNEKTSKKVGKKASKLLRSKKTSKTVKSVAGSALTQRPDKKKSKKKK